MAYERATYLADVLRRAGIKVVERQGWRTRGLSGGTFVPRAVVWHHDASPPGNSPGVPAFIEREFANHGAHAWVDRAGTWHLIASGRAAHTGAVRAGMPNNSTSLGIETDHTVNEAWPTAQIASLRKGTAAILRYWRRNEQSLHFHRTICDPVGRKIDPDGLDLGAERRRVHYLISPTAPSLPAATPRFPGPFGIKKDGTKVGDLTGPHVAHVQRRLRVDTSGGGLGVFGPRTRAAVVTFQRARPWLWPADGVVGPKTYSAIGRR